MLGACDEADDCDLMANVLEVASLKELSAEMSLSPNPFKEDVETFMIVTQAGEYTINIYDVYGKIV